MSFWFVVQCNPQREAFVSERLGRFEPYLPQIKTLKGRIAPLFPSYLFVPAVPHWSPIKNCVGVRCLLMSGESPARIPADVITSWRNRERGGLVQLPPPPRFKSGERLRITRGTLRHRIAVYVGMSGRDRERVLIEMLGQMVPLNIPTVDLAAEAPPSNRQRLRTSPNSLYGR